MQDGSLTRVRVYRGRDKGDIQQRFWAKVEKTPTCWNWIASKSKTGYGEYSALRDAGMSSAAVHRASYVWLVGPIPDGLVIDHMCHNRACVNPDHLRVATKKQNAENHQGAHRDSKSQVRGVVWNKKSKRWQARVDHDGASYHVGYFRNLEDAKAAVIAKRNELFTHNDLDRIAG